MSQGAETSPFEIYIDGSSRGNPGPAGCGVIIRDGQGVVLLEEGFPLAEMTNNAAEYTALVIALEEALLLKAPAVKVHADSELLVRQISGEYRVRNPELKVLHARASRLAGAFSRFTIEHVARQDNLQADRLAQQASRESRKALRGRTNPADGHGTSQKSLF